MCIIYIYIYIYIVGKKNHNMDIDNSWWWVFVFAFVSDFVRPSVKSNFCTQKTIAFGMEGELVTNFKN